MFGICPAGGNHCEIGNKRSYLVVTGESDELSHIPTKREILGLLLIKIRKRNPILIVGLDNPDIPTIHNFYPKEYKESIRHCGYGFFEGQTEKGEFSFDAGGAMRHHEFEGGWLSWSPLRAADDVLDLLGYDFEKVEKALQNEISEL